MFLVCGEALFDVFVQPGAKRVMHLEAHPGGSPFNVAIGLARLGQPVGLLAGIADDFLGRRLAQVLEEEGVSTASLVPLDAPSTLAFIQTAADGQPVYAFYGNGAADRLLTPDRLPPLDPAVRAIHLGSYASVVRPVADAYAALAARERGRCVISYDPNVRLNVEPSKEAWRAKVDELTAIAHVVKISDEDIGLLYGDIEPAALALQWLARGVKLVIVTRGAEGAAAWTEGVHAEVPGVKVDVIDTVGAGDTFQAATLDWLARQGRLTPEAIGRLDAPALAALLGHAARAAAITCSRRGADLARASELAY
ncbi:carbohydrate kinase family protein [Derxia gummosa]|uniref:Carbohydrate kinase family protein n=1 Tax=Derxia gummosa DSM 723 TaxID=1121388 RepID=A0A8B6X690_9BURK|nr:carbohydrate kinase [Derxia gummosa]